MMNDYTGKLKESSNKAINDTPGKSRPRPSFNMSFKQENYDYVTVMSRIRGQSRTQFINDLIESHMNDNMDTYKKAQAFLDEL